MTVSDNRWRVRILGCAYKLYVRPTPPLKSVSISEVVGLCIVSVTLQTCGGLCEGVDEVIIERKLRDHVARNSFLGCLLLC